jgi:hypothetical protein|tara:strand:- start:12996 stop:13541 length:546 start_codon:yes stop_codon:yes gene_type:complete
MILRSKKTIGMPLKYKKRSTKVSSHISSPQAKNIPDEVIKIVLDYLDFKDPINKIYNSKKNAELTIALRKHMNCCMGTTIYSASSIKYFRHLCEKQMRNLFINRNDYIHNHSYKGNLREYLNSCEGEENSYSPKFHEYRKCFSKKTLKPQCCAKNKNGKRCKRKTFMLFCNHHKDPKPYWI